MKRSVLSLHDLPRLAPLTLTFLRHPEHPFVCGLNFAYGMTETPSTLSCSTEKRLRCPVPIATFPIASEAVQAVFTPLREALKASPELKRKLFQVEFLSTQSGQVLVTLIYHRQLDEKWEQAARVLSEQLNILLIGRSRGQKITLTQDWLEETLTINMRAFRYKQPEQAFIQPNAYVNERMIEWAMSQISGPDSDLLELYCGIGNFTIPLATQFQRVLATEVSKVATRAAVENLALNGVTNVEFARLSAEEMTIAMAGTRTFRRLASLETALEDYNLHTVFVDPPRAGLDSWYTKSCQRV